MGCDIHLRLEKMSDYNSNGKYEPVLGYSRTDWRLEADYDMFAALADVRNGNNIKHIELKGFPDDACNETIETYGYIVRNDWTYPNEDGLHVVNIKTANEWLNKGWSAPIKHPFYKIMSGPDFHSPNYCNADEWEKAIDIVKGLEACRDVHPDYYAVLAVMRSYEKSGYIVRAVFWFDN